MAWSVIQSASSASTAQASTKAVTFSTANLSSGSKIIAAFGGNDVAGTTITVGSVQDGSANSLTQCGFLVDTTNQVFIGLYAMDTPAGDVGTKPTITVTYSAGTPETSMWIGEVSGLATGNTTAAMLDGTAATTSFAGTTSHAQPAYTSTAANEWLVSLEADQGGPQTVTQPAGYTLDSASITNNSLADIAASYKNSTNGAESGTWSFGGTTTPTALMVVAFKVAGGGGPPPSQVLTAAAYRPPAAPQQVAAQLIGPATASHVSGPNYAGAAADLGGGSGSWTSPANADGAQDGSYATWAVP